MFKKSPRNTKERKRFRRKKKFSKIKKIGILVGFETKLKKKIRKLLRNIIEICKKKRLKTSPRPRE